MACSGAHCAPNGGVCLKGQRMCPCITGWDAACAAALRARRGKPGFPPSCQSSPFPLGRAARARVSSAFQLPPSRVDRVSRTDATPEMARRGRRALRGGVTTAILVAFQQLGGAKFGVTHLARAARPYLRQQMPQIFGQMLTCLLSPKRKRGDSQEGRNFVSPLLCACGA